jgi:hypothetical protein
MTTINLTKLTTFISINNIENIIKESGSFDNLKNIVKESGIEVREIEDEELSNLYLLVTDKNVDKNALTPLQMECNGIILEKNTNKIVCMCQNKFTDIVQHEGQVSQIEDLKRHYSKFRMEYCEDGTVIRLYNYNNNWYTATTRCIDATKSYWSSEKTFNDMFWEIFNTCKLYIFIYFNS